MELGMPLYVVWETTLDCNAKCVHCYSDAVFGKGKEYWPLAEAIDLIDQIADAGVIILALSGGEVLMRRDWEKLVAHGVMRGLRMTMATNGRKVTSRTAARLAALGIWNVSVSIDGASPAMHDAIRGIPGLFSAACRAVRHLVEAGIRVTVNYTPMKPNLADAEAMIELAWRLGAAKINMTEYVYTSRGGVDLMPSATELGCLLDRWQTAANAWQDRIVVDWHDCRVGLMLKGEEAARYRGCGAGYTHCRITVDGDVTPCVVLPTVAGNLRESRFADIWHKSPILERIRSRDSIVEGNCADCEHKARCGGCRAVSQACFGHPFGGDPSCWIKPQNWNPAYARPDITLHMDR